MCIFAAAFMSVIISTFSNLDLNIPLKVHGIRTLVMAENVNNRVLNEFNKKVVQFSFTEWSLYKLQATTCKMKEKWKT